MILLARLELEAKKNPKVSCHFKESKWIKYFDFFSISSLSHRNGGRSIARLRRHHRRYSGPDLAFKGRTKAFGKYCAK